MNQETVEQQVQIEKKSQEIKVVGRYFHGIKLSLYFAELYEVLKGTKPPNYVTP